MPVWCIRWFGLCIYPLLDRTDKCSDSLPFLAIPMSMSRVRQALAMPPMRPVAVSLPLGPLSTRPGSPPTLFPLISVPSRTARVTARVVAESKSPFVFLMTVVRFRLGVTMNLVRNLKRLLFPA